LFDELAQLWETKLNEEKGLPITTLMDLLLFIFMVIYRFCLSMGIFYLLFVYKKREFLKFLQTSLD